MSRFTKIDLTVPMIINPQYFFPKSVIQPMQYDYPHFHLHPRVFPHVKRVGFPENPDIFVSTNNRSNIEPAADDPPEVHPYRCGFDEVAALHRFRFVSKEKPLGAGHGGAEDSMEDSMVLWLKI